MLVITLANQSPRMTYISDDESWTMTLHNERVRCGIINDPPHKISFQQNHKDHWTFTCNQHQTSNTGADMSHQCRNVFWKSAFASEVSSSTIPSRLSISWRPYFAVRDLSWRQTATTKTGNNSPTPFDGFGTNSPVDITNGSRVLAM